MWVVIFFLLKSLQILLFQLKERKNWGLCFKTYPDDDISCYFIKKVFQIYSLCHQVNLILEICKNTESN